MNIHEYQAKALLKDYGVAVLRGQVAYTPDEAEAAARELGGPVWVVKAQIHAGGRGKGGGVKLARSVEEVRQLADQMLGMTLVTHQTGPEGRQVRRVYVEDGCEIARELYLGAVIDRADVARHPHGLDRGRRRDRGGRGARPRRRSIKVAIDPAIGFQPFHGRQIAFGLGLEGKQVSKAVAFMRGVYRAFTELDASLVEINPLVVTDGRRPGRARRQDELRRQRAVPPAQVVELRDLDEEDPHEIEASRHELNYIKLDGNIGCMVNGAGLAMATMDIIKLYGGAPANFLDVGGGATKERVTAAFKLLLSDPKVEGVLVNIFGGIMRCDVIAEGVVAAAREVNSPCRWWCGSRAPTSSSASRSSSESGLPITAASDLADAAEKVVAAVGKARPDVGPGRSRHQGHLPGLHRRPGHVPLRAGDRLRHRAWSAA